MDSQTGSKICENVNELRDEMHRTRGELVAAAERTGLQVAAAGTHPISSWIDQVISPANVTNTLSRKWDNSPDLF